MKRIRHALITLMLPLLLIVAMAGVASATGTVRNSVEIQRDAQYDLVGSELQVGLLVTCRPGDIPGAPGQVSVNVNQKYPETPVVTGATGVGLTNVVCDGKPRYATVTIFGAGFDGGWARATATLTPPLGGGSNVTVTRDIFIVAN